MIPEQLATFDGRIDKIKETYTSFNSSDLSCARRLVKNEKGWYYSE